MTAPVYDQLKLPGLVSALRPLKRGSSQLAEEATLLRRFTYKNKNQHKGCGWWRKIVEVDRVVERVGTELQGLLGEFGIDKAKDEIGAIDQSAVITGLLRLPRSMLIVEKSVEVMLRSASILEQLIHSRAFLSFAVVVVSLIARLHTLVTVLFEDLGKASVVLVRLVHANSLLDRVKPRYHQLPRSLRRFFALEPPSLAYDPTFLTSANSSLAPSWVATPLATSPAPSPSEEYGAIVSRSDLKRPKSGGIAPSPAPIPTPAPSEPGAVEQDDFEMAEPAARHHNVSVSPVVSMPASGDRKPERAAEARKPSSTSTVDLSASAEPAKMEEKDKEKTRLRSKEKAAKAGVDGEVKRKKKKRVRAKGEEDEDEIDSIFG